MFRVLRKADGTGVFVGRQGGAALRPGDYRLELTFRRDNRPQDPQLLRRLGAALLNGSCSTSPGSRDRTGP
jgi:hypothetical protein